VDVDDGGFSESTNGSELFLEQEFG